MIETKINYKKIYKILAIILFIVFSTRLFTRDLFYQTFNLLLIDIDTNLEASTTWIFSREFSIFFLLIRWATIVNFVLMIVNATYDIFKIKFLNIALGLLVGIINFILIKAHMFAINGEDISILSFRGIQFVIENLLVISISVIMLVEVIKNKIKINKKEVMGVIIIFLIASLAVFPPSVFYNLLGNLGKKTKNFSYPHILLLLSSLALLIVGYIYLRKKDMQTKKFFLTFISLSAYIIFFYDRNISLGAIPLHLCNMAVLIILIADYGNFRGAFYFTYFANVIGAIAALLVPNNSWDTFYYMQIKFAYVHMYVFVVPVLAVALGRFSKPVFKDMMKAIGIFTIYFVLVATMNAWLNNYNEVDYFYIYSDFISSKVGLRNLQYQYVLELKIGDLTFKYFYVFQIMFYFGYILLMWLSWYVFDLFYRSTDEHRKLKLKEQEIMLEKKWLKEQLGGKPLGEPINKGGIDMIKISNFSKSYGKSNKLAVDNFSLEVNRGEVFGFIGHNGAGKSTTIKALVGIHSITQGEIDVCGYSLKHQPLEAKRKIGYVSDNHAVYEKLTGREYIDYLADLYEVSEEDKEQRLNEMLDKLQLRNAIDQEAKSYSHGMKQKLVVIASLIHNPEVWVLDEPLTGLDPRSSTQIKDMMTEHAAKGNIVFFSSHVIEVVEKICDRVAVISEGKLLNIYTKEDIVKNKIVLEDKYHKEG